MNARHKNSKTGLKIQNKSVNDKGVRIKKEKAIEKITFQQPFYLCLLKKISASYLLFKTRPHFSHLLSEAYDPFSNSISEWP